MIAIVLLYLTPVLLVYKLAVTFRRLRHIPGPIANSFTNITRLSSVVRRDPHNEQVHLHQRYGDIVRLGPNTVSVAGGTPQVNYIQQIYGIGKGLIKSDFYAVFQNIINGKRAASLVAMTDEAEHSRTKRTIAHAYSLSTLVEFEPLVDSTTTVFLRELESRFVRCHDRVGGKSGISATTCDLGRWLQFFAFDVIGELTFSKRLGFIETGEDVNDIIKNIGANFDYFSVLSQMPWLDETFLGKNPVYVRYFRKPVASPIIQFAQQLLKERLQETATENDNTAPNRSTKPDFLTRFLQIRKESEEPMTDGQMLSLLFMNINAGSDTIASTLRAIFYYLLMNPSTLDTLVTELETAHQAGHLTLPCPTWHETQSEHTPYLRAVIKEGLRMHPALSLTLERVVPPNGMTFSVPKPSSTWCDPSANQSTDKTTQTETTEIFLPGGTIVGINPYVHHRNPTIFGPNATQWHPSRWLSSAQAPSISSSVSEHTTTQEHLRLMESNLLAFGAGKRSCMGKHIAMLELHKLIPAILMKFKLSWANNSPFENGHMYKVRNSWVLGAEGLVVDIIPRPTRVPS